MITWINKNTKVVIKEKSHLIYLVAGITYDQAKIETINSIADDGVITLSNQTKWTISEFTKALESRDIELICNCNNSYTMMAKIRYFSLFILACPSCKLA
jgi:hypothetical protein